MVLRMTRRDISSLPRLAAVVLPAWLLAAGLTSCGGDSGDEADAAAEGSATRETVVEREVASADGVTIRYDVRGAGDPTLVLIPGWTNPRGIWGEHPGTLSRTNRVVTIDLAGQGASDSNRDEWTMGAFGEDVVAVVEALELDRVVLVGYSMGAFVAIEAAPRLGDRVLGVVFVDDVKDPDFEWTEEQLAEMETGLRATWMDPASIRAFAFTPDAPDSLIDYVIGLYDDEPREHWFSILRAVRDWHETELGSSLAAVEAPIAAINAAEPPTNVQAIRRYAPEFSLDTLAGVGHGGVLLRRVDDFDARLLDIVKKFITQSTASEPID